MFSKYTFRYFVNDFDHLQSTDTCILIHKCTLLLTHYLFNLITKHEKAKIK